MKKGNKSIIKTASVGVAALSLFASAALAGVAAPSKVIVAPVPESFYNAHEFYGSVAALLAARTNDGAGDSTSWGVNVEAGYFYTRNFGIAIEGSWLDMGRPLWGSALNLYLRAPLSESSRWAPYLFAGAGALWTSNEARFEGHVGAGIEYRFTQKVGAFLDGRHTWVDGQGDEVPQAGLFRAGFRFVF